MQVQLNTVCEQLIYNAVQKHNPCCCFKFSNNSNKCRPVSIIFVTNNLSCNLHFLTLASAQNVFSTSQKLVQHNSLMKHNVVYVINAKMLTGNVLCQRLQQIINQVSFYTEIGPEISCPLVSRLMENHLLQARPDSIRHCFNQGWKREAQLPLRNRASAMHFFVAVTFNCRNDLLLHLSPPKSTSGIFVMHTANKLQHVTATRAHDARPHCRMKSPFQRTPANTRISFILPETRDSELHDSYYNIGLICIYFYAIVFESQEKLLKTSVNARPHCPLTSPREPGRISVQN